MVPITWRHFEFKFTQTVVLEEFTFLTNFTRRTSFHPSSNCSFPFKRIKSIYFVPLSLSLSDSSDSSNGAVIGSITRFTSLDVNSYGYKSPHHTLRENRYASFPVDRLTST